MSQLLINEYLKQLDVIKKVSGSQRETIVCEAFKDLLKAWGRQQELVFLAEYAQAGFQARSLVHGRWLIRNSVQHKTTALTVAEYCALTSMATA